MVKVLITACTRDEHGHHNPGEVIELSDGEATQYVKNQWGLIVERGDAQVAARGDPAAAPASSPIETATVASPENALSARGRKKKAE